MRFLRGNTIRVYSAGALLLVTVLALASHWPQPPVAIGQRLFFLLMGGVLTMPTIVLALLFGRAVSGMLSKE